MANTKTVEVNGKKYTFFNESGNTRSGFYHKSVLFINDNEVIDNRCNYYNRTWECYQYQTVMKYCLYKLKNNRVERLKERFKTENGYSKMTQKRLEEFQKVVDNDALYNEYMAVLEAL